MKKYGINEHNHAIDNNGEVVSLTSFPHFNGANWFEFETEDERQQYIEANRPPVVWDKATYCEKINAAHNGLFETHYKAKNYLTIGEISLWLNDSDFGVEAQSLITWWNETCKQVSTYCDTITEETALPIEDFINSLPQFN